MDIRRKLEITAQAIASISAHDDEDSTVRLAALERVKQQAEDAAALIRAAVAQEVAQAVG